MQTREKIENIFSDKSDEKTVREVFEEIDGLSSSERFKKLNIEFGLVYKFCLHVVKNYPDLTQKVDEFVAQDMRLLEKSLPNNVKTFDYQIAFDQLFLTDVLVALPEDSAARKEYRELVAARCALEKETEKLVTELYPAKLGNTHAVLQLISKKKSQTVELKEMRKRKSSIAHEMRVAASTENTVKLTELLKELEEINRSIPEEYDNNPLTKNIYHGALLAALSNGFFHCADMILETGIDINKTREIKLLQSVARHCSIEAVEYLLKKGANDIDVPDLQLLSVYDDKVFANFMLIYERLKPKKDLNISNDSYRFGADLAKAVKTSIYYYIKKQPLERRIKLCEQAFDPNTFIGSIMHIQRGSKKASKDHGTLWWVDKWIYQPSLRERGEMPKLPGSVAKSPNKDKDELGNKEDTRQEQQARLKPDSFEAVSAIIDTYSKLTHIVKPDDVDTTKTNIEDVTSVKPQSIEDVINGLRTPVYLKNQNEAVSLAQLLADKASSNATAEKNLLQLLTDIVRTGSNNANEIADIILEDPVTVIFRMFTSKNHGMHITLVDDLIEYAEAKAMTILLRVAPGYSEKRHPNTNPINYARSVTSEDIQRFIHSLEKLALKSGDSARKVYEMLSHITSTGPGEQNNWNFCKTVARHQDTQSFLALTQLLEKLAENGISQEEIKALLPTDIDWFNDKQNDRDTKLNLLNIIEELPVNERIAMCEKALDPNHPLGHTMFLKRGDNACQLGHGTLGKIEKVRTQAIALRDQANKPVMLDNNAGMVNKLWLAAITGKKDDLKQLIAHGGNVFIQDNQGHAAIHNAAAHGDVDALHLLLKAGADINCRTIITGTTPLQYAASHGKPRALKAILKAGGDPDAAQYIDNATALLMACQRGNLACVEALLQGGADASIPLVRSAAEVQKAITKNNASFPGSIERAQHLFDNVSQDEELFITPAEIARIFGHDDIADMIDAHLAKDKNVQAESPVITSNPTVIPIEDEVRVEVSPEVTTDDISNHPYLQLAKSVVIEKPQTEDRIESDKASEAIVDDPAPPSYEEAMNTPAYILIPDLPYPRFFAAKSGQNMFRQEEELNAAEVTVTGDLLLSFEPIIQPDLPTFPESEDLPAFDESQIAEEQLRTLEELKVPGGTASKIGQFGKQGNAVPNEETMKDDKKPAKTALLN